MRQLQRHEFQHFINTATITGETSNPTWKQEGEGVESLSVTFSTTKDTFKPIIRATTETVFQNYQISSSISGKRCYEGEEIYEYLDELRRKAISGQTQLIEIDTAKTNGTAGNYQAVMYDILITITEWLGENATISYDIDYSNPKTGIATISGSTITFTEDANTSL